MNPRKMHANEVPIDESLVRRLLAAQFPAWADLPTKRVESAGTDNAIYRLGDDMSVRLPRIHWATAQVAKEHAWLPRLAPHLPLAIPTPIARGAPAEGYPWDWSVQRWLPGENATVEDISENADAAIALAAFVTALHRVDTTGGPPPGTDNFFRGAPLALRDAFTRDAIGKLDGIVDTDAAAGAWDSALRTSSWNGPSVWVHGDLLPGNLLVEAGRLTAVIDFGCLGVGDPAADMIPAWSVFSADARQAFRDRVQVDDATWARGRGWALSIALIQLPYYKDTNPGLAAVSRFTIAEVLAD